MKKYLFFGMLFMLMAFTGCKHEVESITLNTERIMMEKGSSRELKAVVLPDKAPQDVLWKSNDITVAKVIHPGGIYAVGEGECKIIAYAGDKRAECTVIVFAKNGGDTGHAPIEIPTDLKYTVNGVDFELSGVEGGSFIMGGTPEQGSDADKWEFPTHKVTLTAFNIMKTEVTQALWKAVMGKIPSDIPLKNDSMPVYYVNWYDCQAFVDSLNRKLASKLKGKKFSLPTEAQWEFAARGGNLSKGYKFAGSNIIDEVGWHPGNSGGNPHPVAKKRPNELGLYDMSGNVYEWCMDWKCAYRAEHQTDPCFLDQESEFVKLTRGGGWYFSTLGCRVTSRGCIPPTDVKNDVGLRLVLQ